MNARALLAALLVADLAGPAAAMVWRREALARWGFDDISVRDKSGSRRATVWSQGYDAAAHGPLLLPAVGELDMRGSFADGFDVGQAVNTPDAQRKILSWSANGSLFNENLRRLIQFSPSASWAQSQEAANNDAPSRVRKQESVGFSGGLSLPRLPSISLSRAVSRNRDPSSASPVDEKTLSSSENLGWSRGAFRLALERHISSNQDVTGRNDPRESETRQGRAEYQRFNLKKLGLQALSLRSAVASAKTQGELRQKDINAGASLRSLPFKRGRWQHSSGFSGSYYRNALTAERTDSGAADMLSNMETRWGSVSNSMSLGVNDAAATSRSASEAVSFSERFRKGRLGLTESVSSGWGDSAGGAASRTDAASARVSLIPRPGQDVSFGFEAASGRVLGGGPASLTQKGDCVANLQVRRRMRLYTSIEEERQRAGDTGVLSVSDRAGLGIEGSPRQAMTANLHAALTRNRTSQGVLNQTSSAAVEWNWFPTRRLTLNALFAVAGQSTNMGAGLSWTAGRTALSISYSRQEISTNQSYSHLNMSLIRSF